MQGLTTDITRSKVTTTRGVELPVKEHNGWKYVNCDGKKIGLTKIEIAVNEQVSDDPFLDYVLKGWYQTTPCPAMEYFFYRYRNGKKISVSDYKIKFNIQRKKN